MVFREQQKLNSSYLNYLIYHEATFIVNTAGSEGENTEIDIPYLVQKKNNKNYLHPLPPSLTHESRLSAMQPPPITFRKRSVPPLVTKPFVIIEVYIPWITLQ